MQQQPPHDVVWHYKVIAYTDPERGRGYTAIWIGPNGELEGRGLTGKHALSWRATPDQVRESMRNLFSDIAEYRGVPKKEDYLW